MANRRFRSQFRYGLEAMVVELFLTITFDASGDPTLSNAQGIASIAHDSTGQYTITLQDKYQALLGMDLMMNSGTSAAAAPLCVIEADAIAASKTLTLQYRDIDNSTAADPAEDEVHHISLKLKNSSI